MPPQASADLHPNQAEHPTNLTRRRFLQAAGLSAAGFTLYTGEHARHDLEITHLPMVLRNLPEPFQGFRIVQLSDIHLDQYTEPFYLHHVIRQINQIAPDLLLITGDFITHGPPRPFPEQAIYDCAKALQALTCPQRLGVLGNHDSNVGASFITRVLHDHDTPILSNRSLPIERDGKRLWIAGVEDPATSHPDLNKALPHNPDGPTILMAHAPDYADTVVAHPQPVDYILSGHSHGGQVRLPLIGPVILPPMGRKYVMGHFQFGQTQLYVNRGMGSVGLPFRLNCRPELTVFTLTGA